MFFSCFDLNLRVPVYIHIMTAGSVFKKYVITIIITIIILNLLLLLLVI